MRRLPLILVALSTAAAPAPPPTTKVSVTPAATAVTGSAPGIAVGGLRPGEAVRIHAYARFGKWEPGTDGRWVEKFATYQAWADVRADRRGQVAMDRYPVERGTYSGVDGYGLLWSMRRPSDPILSGAEPTGGNAPTPAPGTVIVYVTRGRDLIGYTSFNYAPPPGLTVIPVAEGRLNGAFAYPARAKRRPTIILLHGSEGGGADEARTMAVRYAAQGYAAFALNYFAWDLKGLKGPPNYHVNQPIELIAQVRDWLATRPEADVKRLGLYGHSKGAEYSAVAASYYPWVKAVIACVPSDVVWEGYGINDGRNRPDPKLTWPRQRSSWSWQGKALPYVPLMTYEARRWFDNTERYSVSRASHPAEAQAAAIPVERSRARFLLLGGGRDEVWASGEMAESLGRRLGARASVQVYPTAGHQICGDGTYPTHIWADASTDPRVKDPLAEGAAAADAWSRIKAFLARNL